MSDWKLCSKCQLPTKLSDMRGELCFACHPDKPSSGKSLKLTAGPFGEQIGELRNCRKEKDEFGQMWLVVDYCYFQETSRLKNIEGYKICPLPPFVTTAAAAFVDYSCMDASFSDVLEAANAAERDNDAVSP